MCNIAADREHRGALNEHTASWRYTPAADRRRLPRFCNCVEACVPAAQAHSTHGKFTDPSKQKASDCCWLRCQFLLQYESSSF